MKILIVDDDEMALSMLENVLQEAGYNVLLAQNGKEALEILRRDQCRMVISDWEMPEMNGLELCKTIRDNDTAGYTYIILLTSHNDEEAVVAGMTAGADDFIVKPFKPSELTVRIRAGERVLNLETRDIAILAMAKLAESRDPETGAHLERVQNYCRVLARQLYEMGKFSDELNPEFIRLIYSTSPLHDIGKVGIPDTVLLKPGRLSDREFEIMKTHTQLGARTLEAALDKFPHARFLQMARDIALSHHEWYNGHGYPKKLAGNNIPLSGRIVTIADVYDALTSKRVYKDAFDHEVARAIIMEESGTHFDPVIIEAFDLVIDQFVSIRNQYQDAEAEIVF